MLNFIRQKVGKQALLRSRKEIAIAKELVLDKRNDNTISTLMDNIPVFSNTPLFVKLSFILNFINDFTTSDRDINWELINSILKNSNLDYDYNINIPTNFHSLDQLYSLRTAIFMAANDVLPFYEQECKTCVNTFTLNYGEIDFYINNNLKVPTHCKACIKARKNV